MTLLKYLYNTEHFVKNQNTKILFSEPSKVIFTSKNTENVKSLNWLLSKRTNFLTSENYLFIGNKKIKREHILNIDYFEFKSLVFTYYNVLKLKLKNDTFVYIGLAKNPDLIKNLHANQIKTNSKNKLQLILVFFTVLLFLIYFVLIKF